MSDNDNNQNKDKLLQEILVRIPVKSATHSGRWQPLFYGNRKRWPPSIGIGGRHAPDCAILKKIELERLSEAAIKRRLVITRPDPTTNPPTDRALDTLKDSANSDKTEK